MELFSSCLSLTLLLGVLYYNGLQCAGEPVALSYFCMDISGIAKNDKSPVLLLHGLHGYKEIWLSFAQLLSFKTGRKVCAADLRNHGESPWSDEAETALMADDVNLLLETLNIPKVVILGHSLGGKTTVQFSLDHPEKVEKLIVEDMRPNGVSEEGIQMLNSVNLFEELLKAIPEGADEKQAKAAVHEYTRMLLEANGEKIKPDANTQYYLPLTCSDGKCDWKSNMKVLEKIRTDTLTYLSHSKGLCDKPALFIYGDKSPLKVGEVEEEIMSLFPKARLVEVAGAAHTVHDFHIFKEHVIDFINEE